MDINKFHFKKFGPEERSTFRYWYYHWKAFNLVAMSLHVWKLRYLFHDIEKPWLLLLWKDYKRVQKWHRTYNSHHLEYKGAPDYDFEAMAVDWECSRFTKKAKALNARDEAQRKLDNGTKYADVITNGLFPVLDRLGL